MNKVKQHAAMAFLLASVPLASVWGQEQDSSRQVDKFEVTGSHIKRMDVEGPSPVTVLDREFLDRSGSISVSDILRENSASSFGGVREQSGSNAAGTASVNLRGLGAERTLVLLNGRRLPADGVTGTVDLNMIPLAAVERIEILKDGASAIYGSDALGGVVNIITRSNYSGAEISYRKYVPTWEGGAREEMSVVAGASTAKTSVISVLNYRRSEMVYDRDRSWSRGATSVLGSPGSYEDPSETVRPDPNCPQDRVIAGPGGSYCSFDFSIDKSMLPEMDLLGSMTTLKHEISNDTTFFARFGANRRRASWVYAPAPGQFKVPGSVAGTLGPGGGPLPGVDADDDLTVHYRLTELGNRVSEIETTSFNTLIGLNGHLFGHWDWEIAAMDNRVHNMDVSTQGYAITSTLEDLVRTGAFNPFAPEGQRGDLSSARFEPWERTTSSIQQVDAKISGELFDLPGGSAALAFGVMKTFESYENLRDSVSLNGNAFGSAGSIGAGSREWASAYSELAMPLTKSFEMQIAARHDDYNDVGRAFNPKAGLRWTPTDWLMLRSSAGSGFRAPTLVNLHAGSSEGYPFFIDAVACENARQAGNPESRSCKEQQYRVTSGGNENLQPEQSQSASFGALLDLGERFNFGLDLWAIALNNVVDINYNDMTRAELAGGDLAGQGVIVNRREDGSIIDIVAPLQNLASRDLVGLDLRTSILLAKFGDTKLSFMDDYSRIYHYREQGFPGAGFLNRIDMKGFPGWRNSAMLMLNTKGQELSLSARTIAGQKKEDPTMGRLDTYTEFDLQYGLNMPYNGRFVFGSKNLLATTPPLDDSTPSRMVNPELYDQIGRLFYAGYTQTF